MESEDNRIYENNESYAEGRQTELVITRYLEKSGFTVRGTKGNQKHYDIIIIDPAQDKEYIAQIKSSKSRVPYVTCHNFAGLIQTAKALECEPLMILSFTTKRQFVILDAISNKVLFSNHDDPKYKVGRVIEYNCYEKDK